MPKLSASMTFASRSKSPPTSTCPIQLLLSQHAPAANRRSNLFFKEGGVSWAAYLVNNNSGAHGSQLHKPRSPRPIIYHQVISPSIQMKITHLIICNRAQEPSAIIMGESVVLRTISIAWLCESASADSTPNTRDLVSQLFSSGPTASVCQSRQAPN